MGEEVIIKAGDARELVVAQVAGLIHATAEKATDNPRHRMLLEIDLYERLEDLCITKANQLVTKLAGW